MVPDTTRPEAIEIRRLHPDDWAALREVRLEALAAAPNAFASTLDREAAFDEHEWRRRLGVTAHFGAWAAGARPCPRLVGLVATFPEQPPDATAGRAGEPRDAAATWHLVAMWISPPHRGRGLADRLVAAVCDLAAANGAGQVALWVADANHRAQAVYQRLGFRPTGERGLLRPGEPDLGEARMILDLPSPPRPRDQ
jgi:RimJ/RimL family protein N-acetyltransferase